MIKNLADCIEIILSGTDEEREKLHQTFFKLADTSQFLKNLGLKGEYFTIRYGVISHHKGKDADHNYTIDEWRQISEKINWPVMITKYKDNFNIYLDIFKNSKLTLVGVEVKQVNKEFFVNNVKTVFAKNNRENESTIWKKI